MISRSPDVMGGTPVFAGTRVPVQTIFDYLEAGNSIDDFLGGTPEENAVITYAILSGEETGPCRDIVLLNAAAALSIDHNDMAAGLAAAREAIDSGKAVAALNAWIAKTNSFLPA